MTPVLVIAGTDSSGGAGLTRDTAMAAGLGVAVKPVVTAVTVQTNGALRDIHPVPAAVIAGQIRAAFEDVPPAAVKIGMLGSAACAAAVAAALPDGVPVVLDPVLKTSSGGGLMDAAALAPLLPRITLITPNLPEAAVLSGGLAADAAAMAGRILTAGPQAVLIKDGHGNGALSTDRLFHDGTCLELSAERLPQGKRGSGCSLATAIACHLSKGLPLAAACRAARADIQNWLAS